MKNIYVKSLPLKDVVQNIAMELGTDFTHDCDVYELVLPKTYGQGYILGINFPGGIGLIVYDLTLKLDFEIAFTVSEIHPAKFLYLMDGAIYHRFEDEQENHHLLQHQSTIVASNDHHGHILYFEKGSHIRLCSIEINRKEFMKSLACDIVDMETPLQELFLDETASHTFFHNGGFSLKLYDLLRGIDHTSSTGFARKLHLMQISMSVILEQAISYRSDIDMKPEDILVKSGDAKLAQKAITFLFETLDKPTNIRELAVHLGTNTTKLQDVFRFIYGMTVNDKIKLMRIEKAADLLVNTDKSVSTIINSVGLVNRGYFSKTFKRVYNTTPMDYRLKNKADRLFLGRREKHT